MIFFEVLIGRIRSGTHFHEQLTFRIDGLAGLTGGLAGGAVLGRYGVSFLSSMGAGAAGGAATGFTDGYLRTGSLGTAFSQAWQGAAMGAALGGAGYGGIKAVPYAGRAAWAGVKAFGRGVRSIGSALDEVGSLGLQSFAQFGGVRSANPTVTGVDGALHLCLSVFIRGSLLLTRSHQ